MTPEKQLWPDSNFDACNRLLSAAVANNQQSISDNHMQAYRGIIRQDTLQTTLPVFMNTG